MCELGFRFGYTGNFYLLLFSDGNYKYCEYCDIFIKVNIIISVDNFKMKYVSYSNFFKLI